MSSLRSETDQLEKLSVRLCAMGGLVEHQLSSAISAFERRDLSLARQVIDGDKTVDEREAEIEQMVIDLLESRRLAGSNLRQAIMAMKVANTLERVGDLSKNIAKRSLVTSREDTADTVASVVRMGRIALRQLHDVLNAYQDRNPDIAVAVWGGDQEIDELFNSIFREILTTMSRDPSRISAGTHLAFVAKNFERIGDHATNIAERIYYSMTGDLLEEARPKTDITSMTVIEGKPADAPGEPQLN
ncbi:phosphate signaling complex protein PhoU [Parvularcula sp. IMCC14364]|uniref:phosphate signaling complex protein PhoU n=1 Tax=Parvularcula sp. IMCC14364 TaxID=3067902 RepID=UPI00274091F1|nr:phosphate signaling complex protein PhoU [Parvularcula sp. IMCC14364]